MKKFISLFTVIVGTMLCNMPANAQADENAVKNLNSGISREAVVSSIGMPQYSSSSGFKDVYDLNGNDKAVLLYRGGMLHRIYIVTG